MITQFKIFEFFLYPISEIKDKLSKYEFNGVYFGDGIIEINFYKLQIMTNGKCYHQDFLDMIMKLFHNYECSFYENNNFIKIEFMMTLNYLTYRRDNSKDKVTDGTGKLIIEYYDENNDLQIKTVNKYRPIIFYVGDTQMKNDVQKYNL
jgi:hypothetical protein